MKKELSVHDLFWLARYAYNTLDPLMKSAKNYDPSIQWHIELTFADDDSAFQKTNRFGVTAHWQRDRPIMFINHRNIGSKEDIDAVADKVRDFIETEQAALEAAADAAAEELTLADLAADQDFDFRLERAHERAEMERDEDARDIHEQNEMAGN